MRFAILTLVAVLALAATAPGAETIDQALLKRTEENVLLFLNKQKVKIVGVLKFFLAEGQGTPTDVGELNQTLADRLEMALILKTDLKDPIGVVRNATAVAATIPGADHRTANGRKKLFAARYPLAWGTKTVTVDALLAGVVRIEADRSLNVNVVAYLPDQLRPLPVVRFQASADVATLIEGGGSFTTRGLFDGGRFEIDTDKLKAKEDKARQEATHVALQTRKDARQHPASPDNKPVVDVKILYDGREQRIEFRDGEAWVPEPNEGQRVAFVIDRTDRSIKGSLGIVLKVNGENSIEQQRFRDPECRKWILNAGDRIPVKGFLMPAGQKSQQFRVLSPAESEANAFHYGRDVGTITWSVFRSCQAEKEVEVKLYDDLDANVLSRGLFPKETPETLVQLRRSFEKKNDDRNRGLIAEDKSNVIDTPTKTVPFQTDPVPILHATVRYYKK